MRPAVSPRAWTRFIRHPSGFRYNLLAASDAIGMGLNLNIRRVVFSTMEKFDGTTVRSGEGRGGQRSKLTPPAQQPFACSPQFSGHCRRDLSFSEIKQIAGRAGRYKSVFPEGVATAMDARDVELLRAALASPPVALRVCSGLRGRLSTLGMLLLRNDEWNPLPLQPLKPFSPPLLCRVLDRLPGCFHRWSCSQRSSRQIQKVCPRTPALPPWHDCSPMPRTAPLADLSLASRCQTPHSIAAARRGPSRGDSGVSRQGAEVGSLCHAGVPRHARECARPCQRTAHRQSSWWFARDCSRVS